MSFKNFYEKIWGYTPFPWQERLADLVLREGFPATLDLPTGSGKTSVLDIALYHYSEDATAPRRMVFVVDRRLIVDQAFEHACQLRDRFQERFGKELLVARLRGGIPNEGDWAEDPTRPTILVSTVDQVGSRLLFRGYGVSDAMKPVHAGLLGSGAVIFLDEAHLSEPFRQTLAAVECRRHPARSSWKAVVLSATPAQPGQFGLDVADHENETLGKRLRASKPTELVSAKDETAYVEKAREFAKTARSVLIVVNRVDLARRIFNELPGSDKREDGDKYLLIGRCREGERAATVDAVKAALNGGKPFFAVATQCVEAGADYDFGALVTQIAPLDALRQRFGRLNRKGESPSARGAIVATKEDLKPKNEDPVYGDRLKPTWDFLQKVQPLDFGIMALQPWLEALDAEGLQAIVQKRPNAPVLLPAYLDLWTSTSPVPDPDPDVPIFLHGPEAGPPDVQLLWRADIREDEDVTEHVISLAPPRSSETVSLPLRALRRWLSGRQETSLADVEGEAEQDDANEGRKRSLRAFRWAGPEHSQTGWCWPSELRPGETVIVPARYGGHDEWGWAPKDSTAVRDVSAAIRLHPSLFHEEAWPEIKKALADRPSLKELSDDLPDQLVERIRQLKSPKLHFPYGDEPADGAIITGRVLERGSATERPPVGEADMFLECHVKEVVKKAEVFSVGLDDDVRKAIRLAALWHDSGKADRRFQAYLRNGAPQEKLLAKSERGWTGRVKEEAIRQRARLPERWRHEALSVKLAQASLDFQQADEPVRELALWLIGTHHGFGRPFFPHDDALDDVERELADGKRVPAGPGPQRLDADWAGLFERLQRRHGAWELAYYEAVLRLADHRASEGMS